MKNDLGICILGTIFVLFLASMGHCANQLLFEDFDDQALDSGYTVYGENWAVLSPPQYNLNSV